MAAGRPPRVAEINAIYLSEKPCRRLAFWLYLRRRVPFDASYAMLRAKTKTPLSQPNTKALLFLMYPAHGPCS